MEEAQEKSFCTETPPKLHFQVKECKDNRHSWVTNDCWWNLVLERMYINMKKVFSSGMYLHHEGVYQEYLPSVETLRMTFLFLHDFALES